jgi:topoisomerase-4 subunit B
MTDTNYTEASIKILSGLDAVRKRPGMYIGSTDKRGLHHLVWEIVDNAVDEVIAGFADTIIVTLHDDLSVSISDNGRGIPTGMHESGRPTPEVIYTVLHAGGKFDAHAYKVAGGLHGVGASVVNALSEWMKVTIYRDGKIYKIQFSDGARKNSPLKVVGTTNKTGTTVRFKPSSEVFSNIEFSFLTICERMQENAFLTRNLKAIVINEIENKKIEYYYDEGLKAFVEYLNEDKNKLHHVVSFHGIKDEIEVDFAFQYTDSFQENVLSFVNNVKTIDGGTHEIGAKTALTKTINEYAWANGYLKGKDKNLDGSDVREGITAIINVKIPEHLLQFEGQTKSKLGTPSARTVVEEIISQQLTYFLEENKDSANKIIEKALSAKIAREAARKAREEARTERGKNKREKILSGKLTPAQERNPKKNELFLVEGDSAGGSAKQARDKSFQAILPLRGKVINTEKISLSEILKNEEINTIIHTIGAGVGADFELKDCEYDKVIIMTDADTDGAHIQTLLLTFFFRYMRPLIDAKKLYIAQPPLYKITRGNEIKYAWTDEELKEIVKTNSNYTIQRFKGLGEMNSDQLWETTMDPMRRQLIQVTIDDAMLADRRVSVLMGNKVEPRREWIEENVSFTLEDDYKIIGG